MAKVLLIQLNTNEINITKMAVMIVSIGQLTRVEILVETSSRSTEAWLLLLDCLWLTVLRSF